MKDKGVEKQSSDHRIELRRLTIPDAIVAVIIVSVSLAVIAHSAMDSLSPSSGPAEAFVYHDGELDRRLPLLEDRQILLDGGKMVVEISNGRVRVSRSECPRQFCVHQGWAEKAGEAIVCVPFKYIVEIHSADGPQLDAVVY